MDRVSGPYRLRLGGRTLKLPEGQSDVGRSPDCWLNLDDDLCSRFHARFHVSGEGVEFEDLNSRNGTFINGEQLEGKRALRDGDRLRVGREVMTFTEGGEEVQEDGLLRQTIGPGENSKFPSLIGNLVEKSLNMGKIKEAERYALALANQIAVSKVAVDHPTAVSAVGSLISLAENSNNGVWLDRVFKLHAAKGWIMDEAIIARVRKALDRIPRMPAAGLKEYEQALRGLSREGKEVPARLMAEIGEIYDAYGS